MARNKKPAPYGRWQAHLTPDMMIQDSYRLGTVKTYQDRVYWCEIRADEGGRGVLMAWHEQEGLREVLPSSYSVRSRVHEYGGGEFCVGDGAVFFVNALNQQIYRCSPSQTPEQITTASEFRFADLEYNQDKNRLIAVAERHLPQETEGTHALPDNMLVYIGLEGEEKGGVSILDQSHDFYASPRLSPDQKTLCWLQWDLPDMPWEAASLMVSRVKPMDFSPQRLSGGRGQTAGDTHCAFGPVWDEEGRLYFVSDQTGMGQLYCWAEGGVELVKHQDEQADGLRPLWVFGMESLAVTPSGDVMLSSQRDGHLLLQHISQKEIRQIVSKSKSFDMVHSLEDRLVGIATTDKDPASLALMAPDTGALTVLRASEQVCLEKHDISVGQLKQFEGPCGPVYGLYYRPAHSQFEGPEGALPPVIVMVHGGPTGMAERGLKLKTQYWTNRGFGVFDVDYSGSSGYGKAYRDRLNGRWGQLDVDDIIAGARFLSEQKLCDPDKLIVKGGSAGGYTALMALVKSDVFKCASCSYPVTDLGQLLEITHKFEHGYIYGLTGTTPQSAKEHLQDQAIVHFINEISAPVIFFQGSEDKVVPKVQPRAVYEALQAKGLLTQMHEFEGEGHGFRKSQTIKQVLAEEERFFQQALQL